MIKNILVGTILVLVMMASAGATVVRVDPESQTVAAGDVFHVNVIVEDVTNIKADQAVLNFDPGVMNVTGVTEGNFLKKTGGNTIGLGTWDNTAGTATFGYSLTGTWIPVGGSGTLATIEFETCPDALAGAYDLNLTNVVLIDANNDEIPTEIFNGMVIIMDKTPPTVEIISPANDTWFDSEDVVVTFHPWDNYDQELNFSISVDGMEVVNGTAANCSEKQVSLGMLPECDHVIRVNVTDDVGLEGSDNITIHVDLTPPTVEIISPANDTWFDSEDVVVTFHPRDNKAGVLDYWVYVDDVEYVSGTAANCSYEVVNLGTLSECDHVIKVVVNDYAGKTGSDNITIHVDLTPPTVAIISPVSRTYASTCVRLNFTAEDPGVCPSGIDRIWYSLDGGANVTITGNITIGGLGAGSHDIVVYVNDTVGKEGSDAISFTLRPGDITGDGIVDIWDLVDLADAYLSHPGDTNWNQCADLNCDGTIDIWDLVILADNYLNKY